MRCARKVGADEVFNANLAPAKKRALVEDQKGKGQRNGNLRKTCYQHAIESGFSREKRQHC